MTESFAVFVDAPFWGPQGPTAPSATQGSQSSPCKWGWAGQAEGWAVEELGSRMPH